MEQQFIPYTDEAIEAIPLDGQVPGWMIALLFLIVVLFAWVRIYQPKRIKLLFNSFTSNQHAGELSREERQSSGLGNPVFELIYFFGFSAMGFYCVQFYKPDLFGIAPGETYLLLTAVILTYVLVKNLLIHLLSWIFDLRELFADILFFRFLSHAILGLLLIPILLLITFPPQFRLFFFWVGVVLILGFFTYRVIRSLAKAMGGNLFSLKYIILYICALEILPILILSKFLQENL